MTVKGSICAACGQPAHRYGRNEGVERFDPQACINGLLGELEAPPSGFTVCDKCEGGWQDCGTGLYEHGCPSCGGSGLLPTEELREAATVAARSMWGRNFPELAAMAVLRVVAETIGSSHE